MRRVARVLFWLALAGVAVATLGPISLRPETGFDPAIERFLAFSVLSLLSGLGYPNRKIAGLLALTAVAAGLEALQNEVPGRHGRLIDFDVKLVGVLAGVAVTALVERLAPAWAGPLRG